MTEIGNLKSHIINYSKTRDIYTAYRKAGYSKNSMKNILLIYFYTKQQRLLLMN